MHPSKIPALVTLALWATAHSQETPQVPPEPPAPSTSPEELKLFDKKILHLKELEKSIDLLDIELSEALVTLKAEKEAPKDP